MSTPADPRPPRRSHEDPRYAPPELDEERGQLLIQYLDGQLLPAEAATVAGWLARDPELRRLAEQHRRLWSALGDAFPAEQASPPFAAATVARALREEAQAPLVVRLRARGVFLAAAALLVGVVGFAFWSTAARTQHSLLDQAVIGHLHVLSDLPFLEAHGEAFDLALDAELVLVFQGEETRR